MDITLAGQIADLLNKQNKLAIHYEANRVLEHGENFEYELDGNILTACVEIKKVQWYVGNLPSVS